MDARQFSLAAALRRQRVANAADLMAALGVSQPTLARLLSAFGPAVVPIGKARRRRYALARSVRGLPLSLPVFRVDDCGKPERIARLTMLDPEGSQLDALDRIEWPLDGAMRDGYFPGLPYFIGDARPQGFLGRAFARARGASLRVPEDPTLWSDDDVVSVVAVAGDDLPGDLIVGEVSLDAFQRKRAADTEWLAAADRPTAYPLLAEAALQGQPPGSSAGGEFPKFTVAIDDRGTARHVIVKFSPADKSPAARRWSDLLVAEHHSGIAPAGMDVPVASSQVFTSAGRTYLEVLRFDRIGEHGRRGVVTLAAIEPALLGSGETHWEKSAEKLRAQAMLSEDDFDRIVRLSLFGRLIGNSDMHWGNLAFHGTAGKLELAPVYDMLPMLFAPTRAGELPRRELSPPPPPPEHESAWREALKAALLYWNNVTHDDRISPAFRSVCEDCNARLERLGERFA